MNTVIARPAYVAIWTELAREKAMVLMAGPRQAGKTTLADLIAGGRPNHVSFNWDVVSDRARLIRQPYAFEQVERADASTPLVVFDEIHKYRHWKNYLKGAYDRFHRDYQFLVTGSGRLDMYRKGGDSLAGRYALFHLWPFTLAELAGRPETLTAFWRDPLAVVPDGAGEAGDTWRRLAQFSGFPEPYVRADARAYRRWSRTYHSQLIREDIRDMTAIVSVGEVETLFVLLPERVGSLLSVTSLAGDLKVAYNTVRSWLEVLERFYLVFTLAPWSRRVARATQKARKLYLLDYAVIEDAAARFENMVAVELLRAVTAWNDLGEGPFHLHFVRNKEKQEVDFLITEKRRPRLLVEAKAAQTGIDAGLRKIQQQLGVPAVQLVGEGTTFRKISNGAHTILVAPAALWLPRLP
jgi:predicted AAA+ superfamily ATPase